MTDIERLTKTFYITIDAIDGAPWPHDSAEEALKDCREVARYAEPPISRNYQRTPFRVDITEDENGKPRFEFTELEEPKAEYWVRQGRDIAFQINSITHRDGDMFTHVYFKDDQGNLILLNPEEKAKVIEEWKNS